MNSVSVGYVGLDHHHRDPYFQLFDQLPVEVTCVCEPNEDFDVEDVSTGGSRPDYLDTDVDTHSRIERLPFYRDPIDLLENENIDLVWITLSHREHPQVIGAAADQGIDIFCEKPTARTAEEFRSIIETIRRSDVTVGTNYYYRYHPIVQQLRELVSEGFFGSVVAVDSRFMGTQLLYRDTGHHVYRREPSRGGVLQWLGVHWLDLLMYILDEPLSHVNAQMVSQHESADVEDSVTLQFETKSGSIGSFSTGYLIHDGKDSQLSIYGSDGTAHTSLRPHGANRDQPVELDLFSDGRSGTGSSRRTVRYNIDFDHPPFGDFVFEYFQQFVRAVQGNGPSPVTVEEIVRVLSVLDASYESNETDQWTTVAP